MEQLTVRQPVALPMLNQTQKLLLRGAALALAMVLLVSGVATLSAGLDSIGFGPNSAALGSIPSLEGELDLTRLRLQRAERLLGYSTSYGIPADLATLVHDKALHEGIDPELAFRLVKLESGFDARAVSSAGAIGLAQVMPATADLYRPGISLGALFYPATNLEIGFRYLAGLIVRYGGDPEMALLAYNRGPARVEQLLVAGRDPRNGYASHILDGYLEAAIRQREELR